MSYLLPYIFRSYDYHGHWDKATGHVSPMYEHPDDTYNYFNTVIIFICASVNLFDSGIWEENSFIKDI